MVQIYNKINNHQYLNEDDIAKFIFHYSNGNINPVFSYDEETVSYYCLGDKSIVIESLNALLNQIVEYEKDNYTNDSNFIVDLYNIYLIFIMFHELEHSMQLEYKPKPLTSKEKLIKENYNFRRYNLELYKKNHDLYYFEFDAEIKSLINTLKIINKKCHNLSENALIEFNKVTTETICSAYGIIYYEEEPTTNCTSFNSPISYTKYLSKQFYCLKRQKLILMWIKKLKNQSPTEYIKLLNGLELSDETMNLLYDVCVGNIKTTNILENVKKIKKTNINYL